MSEDTGIGRLKEALIHELTDQVENGAMVVVDKETGEVGRISCPAAILAVAAKVVKDFNTETAVDPSITRLDEITRAYQLRKSQPAVGTA
jgi:hypothetical protein